MSSNKADMMDYHDALSGLKALISGDTDWLTDLSNTSALLYEAIPRINWVGFYLQRAGKLRLGPFQGKTACVVIPPGKGVCGAAVLRRETIVVKDVHSFPGHIACDSASQSEIVVPIVAGDRVYGVLDVDSPQIGRFGRDEQEFLERAVELLHEHIDWAAATGSEALSRCS